MTLDEAIEFSKYKAEQQYDELQEYEYDAEEHEQLAEWLEELKYYKEKDKKFIHLTVQEFEDVYNKGRTDAIDELLNVCGGKDEDCELCTFAIFKDDEYVSCKLMELKEQK